MDLSKLKRDPKRVHDALQEMSDGRLITKKTCKIIIPSRFAECGLASVGIETNIVGIYAIIVDDIYYGVSLVNAMVRIEPSSTMKIIIDDQEFYEFTFDPGSTVIPSVQLVKRDTLVYRIYDEIISKGHVPWYLGYSELGKIFDTAYKHAGVSVGKNHEVTELLISIIARDPKNRRVYYRQIVKSYDDMVKNPPAFVALRSVIFSATNTTNKLAGSHFETGMISALVNPTERVERIEGILRT